MMGLWIIGNGFDRAHGLPTGYGDYHKFLIATCEKWMANMPEFYFGNVTGCPGNILWSQLEKALGIYSVYAGAYWTFYCHDESNVGHYERVAGMLGVKKCRYMIAVG